MELNANTLKINSKKVCDKIEFFIKEKVKELNRQGIVIGLSGGIDSAVVAYLSVRAVGKENVLALLMPERDSSPDSIKDAKLVAKNLGIETKVIDLKKPLASLGVYNTITAKFLKKGFVVRGLYKGFEKISGNPFYKGLEGTENKYLAQGNAFYRIKHRLRMITLYYYSEQKNYLVAGCCNKTEFLTGFFVKYGDSAADIMPIKQLYKTQVRQIADYLKVPEKIIKKAPSPDLIPGIVDEFALGIDYERLDIILYGLENKMSFKEIAKQLNVTEKKVKYFNEIIKKSKHMRELPYEPD